jgi:Tol biopolymer transport system component
VAPSSGGEPVRLTNAPRANAEPAWSPDGSMLAFASFRNGRPDIYTINADGTGERRLTDDPATDYHPSWTGDGRIVFHTSRTGNAEIFSMRSDGTDLRNLTNNSATDLLPSACRF